MEGARKYLDLWFDFFVFAAGLVYLIGGFQQLYQMQDATVRIADNSRLTYVEEYEEAFTASEIIAFLLTQNEIPVRYNGITYEGEKDSLILLIDDSDIFRITREYMEGVANAPSLLLLEKR